MSTTKKDLIEANRSAVKGFAKSAIKKAFDVLATASDNNTKAVESRSNAALSICRAAEKFNTANEGIDRPTIVTGWREHMALLAMELAVAGHRFADLTPAKDGKPAKAKLIQYGQNVASYAKGVVEFNVNIDVDCKDTEGNVTYGQLRKKIQEYREEAWLTKNPDIAKVEAAKELCLEAWNKLRDAVFSTDDTVLIEALEAMLLGALAEHVDAVEEQDGATEENTAPDAVIIEQEEAA